MLLSVSEIEGVKRIRYTSPHPQEINVELLEVMASRKNICNYVHFPMQSGSNEILKRMNRTYTREHFYDMAVKIRDIMPNCGLSTDIIVGFPGETDDDLKETNDFAKKIDADLNLKSSQNNSNPFVILDDNGDALFRFRQSDDAALMNLYDGGVSTMVLDADLNGGSITVGGNVSGSVTSTGSFGKIIGDTFHGDGTGLTGLTADDITVSSNNSTNEDNYIIFADGNSGTQDLESDTGLRYNPSLSLIHI
mgnify:CR=1 FL=1